VAVLARDESLYAPPSQWCDDGDDDDDDEDEDEDELSWLATGLRLSLWVGVGERGVGRTLPSV
jgi:hypothetical protein